MYSITSSSASLQLAYVIETRIQSNTSANHMNDSIQNPAVLYLSHLLQECGAVQFGDCSLITTWDRGEQREECMHPSNLTVGRRKYRSRRSEWEKKAAMRGAGAPSG